MSAALLYGYGYALVAGLLLGITLTLVLAVCFGRDGKKTGGKHD